MSVTISNLNSHASNPTGLRISSSYINAKRVLDVAAIVTVLPAISVIIALTAVAIKLESKGNVFFWQKRVGMNGKVFNMLKLRSMTATSEKDGSQFAQSNDMRVTRVGKFIRKFRIDELPQMWNVVKGDMSIIGPRPEQESFVKEFNQTIPNYSLRHTVRPGITGLAQTEQGYVADANGTVTKLRYDMYYIRNLSFMTDFQIGLKTIYTIMTGFGAR
jgi:lipopolysaccharide/colanic/teichoic acid biosynthesis glycosyltransferase